MSADSRRPYWRSLWNTLVEPPPRWPTPRYIWNAFVIYAVSGFLGSIFFLVWVSILAILH